MIPQFERAESKRPDAALTILTKMANPGQIVFGRDEMADTLFHRRLCRHRMVRAEHPGTHGLRSPQPVRWHQLRRMADAPAIRLR